MLDSPDLSHPELLKELRALRERGLLRLRDLALPSLTAALTTLGLPTSDAVFASSVVRLLERVLEGLDGTLAAATAYTLGIAPGTRDWPAQDRRREAAKVYGLSVERFRKHQELLILDNVAQEILRLCSERAEPAAPSGRGLPVGGSLRLAVPPKGRADDVVLTVMRRPVETVRSIDVVVSSENVYLQMSKTFHPSLSASLRGAAARRNEIGAIVEDVLQNELTAWLHERGREGMPVVAGTVVPTSPGQLAAQGVRRVYHAAVAIPSPHTNDYVVEPAGVVRAVRQVFDLIRAESARSDKPLRSVCLPLFGAGRGGLAPQTSFTYLWAALESELLGARDREVFLLTRGQPSADAVVAALLELGAHPVGD